SSTTTPPERSSTSSSTSTAKTELPGGRRFREAGRPDPLLGRGFPARDVVAEDEQVHARLLERVDRLTRGHHDRLVLVERRDEQALYAGQLVDHGDECPVAWQHVAFHGLHAPGVVDVVDGGYALPLVLPRLVDEHHERRRVVLLEPLSDPIGEHGRRERPER